MLTSIPYLFFVFLNILFFTYSIFVKANKFNLLFVRVLCISSCIIFFGFRGFIGWDWYNYFASFEDTPKIYSDEFVSYLNSTIMEPGYIIYCSIVKSFINSYHGLTVINCLIDLFFLNWFLRKYLPLKYYAFGFILYFFFGGFYLETDLLRNSRSFFIFLFSIKFIEEKKIVPYYLLNILGVFFHLSSLIYLLVYKVLNLNIVRFVFIFVFIIGNIFFLFQIEYIKPVLIFVSDIIGGKLPYLINVYFTENAKAYGLSIGFIERNLMMLLVILYVDEIKKYKKSYNIFVNSYLIFFILFFFFSEVAVLSIRFGLLFYFSYWILIPIIYDLIKDKIFKMAFLFCLIAFFFLKMHGMSKGDNYSYENILINKSDYNKKKQELEKFMNNRDEEKN